MGANGILSRRVTVRDDKPRKHKENVNCLTACAADELKMAACDPADVRKANDECGGWADEAEIK